MWAGEWVRDDKITDRKLGYQENDELYLNKCVQGDGDGSSLSKKCMVR